MTILLCKRNLPVIYQGFTILVTGIYRHKLAQEYVKDRRPGQILINPFKKVLSHSFCFYNSNLLFLNTGITIHGQITKLFFNTKKLIVFCHTIRATQRSSLNLP